MDSRVHLEKLESDNWSTWSRQFRGLFKSKKLHSIIDGTIKQELDSEKDEQVMGLIELHLGKYLAPMADDCTTAQKLWDKLEATFKAQNTARRLHLRRQLNNLKMEKAEPVTQYIARAKNLAGDLEGVGNKPEPTEVIEASQSSTMFWSQSSQRLRRSLTWTASSSSYCQRSSGSTAARRQSPSTQ